MKSKILLLGFAFALLFTLNSCKSQESAYKAAYDKAKQREMVENTRETTPYYPAVRPAPTPTPAPVVKESVKPIDGGGQLRSSGGLKRYNIVIGSFKSQMNAEALKEQMQGSGYNSFVIQNAQGMYQVIIASYDDRASAVRARDSLKNDYYPDFKDIWILEQPY